MYIALEVSLNQSVYKKTQSKARKESSTKMLE